LARLDSRAIGHPFRRAENEERPPVHVESPTVSVVIPAYNEADRIAGALESVLAQTRRPLEILVVDDGSSDDTARVADRFGARVIAQKNLGISAARNRGIDEAAGEWVALLDADDRWMPERLEWLARASAARPDIDFGFSDFSIEGNGFPTLASNLSRTAQYRIARGEKTASPTYAIGRAALARALAVGNFLGTSTIFVRSELLRRHDLRFDETLPKRTADYQMSEDIEWYLRVLKWTDAIAIERILARYVRHADSAAEAYGRVRYGDVKLGERIRATPDSYAPGAAQAFESLRRDHLRHAAYIDMRTGNFVAARARFAEAQRERYSRKDAFSSALSAALDCGLGRGALHAARATWKRSLRPMVRALRSPKGS